jgi:hypothetical protein
MNNTNELLLTSLKQFYAIDAHIIKLLAVINGTSKISLRLIDWYVTNYSKLNRDTCITRNVGSKTENHIDKKKNLNIYQSYRSQLKAYKKIKFDPFRRRQRIIFVYNQNEELHTTIGQLNFFKWAIENDIIEYIKDNVKSLEENMNDHQKITKQKKLQCHEALFKNTVAENHYNLKPSFKIQTRTNSYVLFD